MPADRLLSLDIFRGLIIAAMILVTDPGTYSARYAPLCHSNWTGPTATDVISPAFLLMIGMALPFSFVSRLQRGVPQSMLWLRTLRRTAMLIVLGLALNALPDFHLATLRVPGILQHIAVCYFAAASLYLATAKMRRYRVTVLGASAVALLALYGALLKFVPVPGFGPGRFDSLGNIAAFCDRAVFGVPHLWPYGTTPGHGVTFDPDGLLSTLSGMAIVLFGVLATEWLTTAHTRPRKAAVLAAASMALIGCGWALGFWIPLIKKLWTPSFALWSAGFALLVFTTIYLLLDVLPRDLAGSYLPVMPFSVFGTNAIFAFALSTVITTLGDRLYLATASRASLTLHRWTYQSLFLPWLSPINASLGYALAVVLFNLALVYPLYRKRIFLRL